MKKLNTTLAVIAAALFLISALSYRNSVQRAERFERGQKFLSNLNPDEIAEIVIAKGSEETRLERQGDEFVLPGEGGYPAKNDAVNRFIKDVLGLSLEKEVGRGESLEKELELTGEEENTLAVTFEDGSGKEMVHFLVGKAFEDGGSYVRRANVEKSTIYLTSARVYFSTDADDFIKKDILDVKPEALKAIEGDGYRFETVDGSLQLLDVPSGMKEKTAEVNKVKNALSYLRFTTHHLADAEEVRGLQFTDRVIFDLQDDSGYSVEVAQDGDKHYLRVEGFHRTPQVQITMDADEEEVKEKSEILARADEIDDFNAFHGSWVYEVSESTADKFRLSSSDLLEDA